jgi:hypothetical protein
MYNVGMNDKAQGAITVVAAALEEELQRFEQAAAATMRAQLRSQRHIDRAVTTLNEAAEAQTRVIEHIQALMVQFNEARDRCQKTADALNERAQEIEARAGESRALLDRFEALGLAAHEINDAVRAVDAKDAHAHLSAIEQKMTSIVDDAQALHQDAQAADLLDLAQQADGLRQQILAARNKVSLAAAKLRPV